MLQKELRELREQGKMLESAKCLEDDPEHSEDEV